MNKIFYHWIPFLIVITTLSFVNKVKAQEEPYDFEWDELNSCKHSQSTVFSEDDFEKGVNMSAKMYPWAESYINKFHNTSEVSHLKSLGWFAVRRQWGNLIIFIFMSFMYLWSLGYFCWRGYKRGRRKLQKMKDRETDKNMSNFELDVAKRHRQNRKRCCLIKFLRLRRVQQLVCLYLLLMSILSLFYLVRIWKHTDSALGAYKTTDCAFHRLLQYIEKGAPQYSLLTEEEKQSLPRSSLTEGYLGLNGYSYYLKQIFGKFSEIPDTKPFNSTVSDVLTQVQQLKTNYDNFFDLTKDTYKIDSGQNIGETAFSDAMYKGQLNWSDAYSSNKYIDNWNSLSVNMGREILNLEEFWTIYQAVNQSTENFKGTSKNTYTSSTSDFQYYIYDTLERKNF